MTKARREPEGFGPRGSRAEQTRSAQARVPLQSASFGPEPLEVVWSAPTGDECVVYKPAGLSSEQSAADGDSLVARVRGQFGWPEARLPHRLDRPTRGLMVVARDAPAAARLSAEQREGRWTKWYFARVPAQTGTAGAEALVGAHKAFLRREGRLARVVRSGGDPSRLEVLATAPAVDGNGAHALVRLDTGRFHQIRAMLAALGFPLIGDSDYGGEIVPHGRGASKSLGAGRERLGVDLEAAALRIERVGGSLRLRLASHRDRVGVDPLLEKALGVALDATAATEPSRPSGD